MIQKDQKLRALTSKSTAKALAISRRLIQSAKRRARRPLLMHHSSSRNSPLNRPASQEGIIPSPPAIVFEGPSFQLPPKLIKPKIPQVEPSTIGNLEKELKDVPLDYVRKALVVWGSRMLGVFKTVYCEPPKTAMPKQVGVLMSDGGLASCPTHVVAVSQYASPPSSPSARISQVASHRRETTLYPVHAVVLAAHCARLPPFPESNPRVKLLKEGSPTISAASACRLPCVTICLPDHDTYGMLQQYLYTLNTGHLIFAMLALVERNMQLGPEVRLVECAKVLNEWAATREEVVIAFSRELVARANLLTVCQFARVVEGVYRNAIALGVSEEGLWTMIDFAWDVSIASMRMIDQSSRASDN
ncbi:hypothetical protein AcW1_002627 [Taiwanofungus camphoratus]|nr:hypothetical protein AcV5_009690 [Antrodia cinnamomea]KAI0942856.1 hypothetical protein AcV7_002152 [Antrodia cinnamomea]KAI0943475.1 hypothetical protein AcW1_002627 [Antrodia cinnamomea]